MPKSASQAYDEGSIPFTRSKRAFRCMFVLIFRSVDPSPFRLFNRIVSDHRTAGCPCQTFHLFLLDSCNAQYSKNYYLK